MYHKLFKRKSKKLFNTNWEFIRGCESKTFKACFNKMKKISERAIEMSTCQGKKNHTQFEIRKYDKNAWGEVVISEAKRYELNLEEIKNE